jgi:hypothetical protein
MKVHKSFKLHYQNCAKSLIIYKQKSAAPPLDPFKVTGHLLWLSAEDRYCTLNISPFFYQIFVKCSSEHAENHKVVKLTNDIIILKLFTKI